MPASSLPAWYTARSTEQASLNSLSSLITVRLNTESIGIFDKSIQPSLVIQGCLPDDVILSSLCLHNIYLSNATLKLWAERARFFPASNRKSVNAKEPSASSACYVPQILKSQSPRAPYSRNRAGSRLEAEPEAQPPTNPNHPSRAHRSAQRQRLPRPICRRGLCFREDAVPGGVEQLRD